eukprot:jgi/Galph1/1196/GphlegSOOS_G6102.1
MTSVTNEAADSENTEKYVRLGPGWLSLEKPSADEKQHSGVWCQTYTTSGSQVGNRRKESNVFSPNIIFTNYTQRHRYSKEELEMFSARAESPAEFAETLLQMLNRLRKPEKSPFVKPKKKSPRDSQVPLSASWERGNFLDKADGEEHNLSSSSLPRREDLLKSHFKFEGSSVSSRRKYRFERNQKPLSSSNQSHSPVWFYKDPQEEIQGPFSLEQLEDWLKAGFYEDSYLFNDNEDFRPLHKVLKARSRKGDPSDSSRNRDIRNQSEPKSDNNDESTHSNEILNEDPTCLVVGKTACRQDSIYCKDDEENENIFNASKELSFGQQKLVPNSQFNLVFGTDVPVEVGQPIGDSAPLEDDLEALERDIISRLDLNSSPQNLQTSSKAVDLKGFAKDSSSNTIEKEKTNPSRSSSGTSDQHSPRNPAEYLMSIDPAIARASVSSPGSSKIRFPEHETIRQKLHEERGEVPASFSSPRYNQLANSENKFEPPASHPIAIGRHIGEALWQGFTRSPKEHFQSKNIIEVIPEHSRDSELADFSNSYQSTEKKCFVADKQQKGNFSDSFFVGPGTIKTMSRYQQSFKEDAQSVATPKSSQQSSISAASSSAPFDNFFKLLSGSSSSNSNWYAWSGSSSTIQYPLSLREIQLQEEQQQKQFASAPTANAKSEDEVQTRSVPWDIHPKERPSFAEIQKNETERRSTAKDVFGSHSTQKTLSQSTKWANKVAGHKVFTSSSPVSTVQNPSKKDTQASESLGFWEIVDEASGKVSSSKDSHIQHVDSVSGKQGPQLNKVGLLASFNEVDRGSFDKNVPVGMRKWCEEQFHELLGSRDITLAEFLASLKSKEEIREYSVIYLGDSRKTNDFVEEFIRRLQFERESQVVVTGSTSSQSGKGGRRKKKP